MSPAELPVLRDVAIHGAVAKRMDLGTPFSLHPAPDLPASPTDALDARIAAALDAAWPTLRAELITAIKQQITP